MNTPDREKVINGLEHCMSESLCYKCPYKNTDECEDGGYYYSKAIEDAITLLKEQPEIIRCKDCKHYNNNYCTLQVWEWWKVSPNGFCADGERR